MALSQPDYDIIIMEDVMIPMRDGVQLATDIYRPAKHGDFVPGPLPIILERTPYDKRSNFPRFDVNPNTGEPLGQNLRTQVALNTVHHSITYPSHVILPLVTSD